MKFKNSKVLTNIQVTVNNYLLSLVHVQQSLTLKKATKAEIFNRADHLAAEMFALTSKVAAMEENSYNRVEGRKYIDVHLNDLDRRIWLEQSSYIGSLAIVKGAHFLISDIIEKLTDKKYDVWFSPDTIDKLRSYRLVVDDTATTKVIKPALDEKKALDNELEAVKEKAFLQMLRGQSNVNPVYFFRVNRWVNAHCFVGGSAVTITSSADVPEARDGAWCVVNRANELTVKVVRGCTRIEYWLGFAEGGGTFTIKAGGYINLDVSTTDSRIDFYLEETFPESDRERVYTTFNIRAFMKAYNDYSARSLVKADSAARRGYLDENTRKRVDDFLKR
jgi:hypothetical protein